MADHITRKPLPHEIYGQIIELSDGVPLFVEELVKTVLESGLLRELDDEYRLNGPLPAVAIPNTLRGSLQCARAAWQLKDIISSAPSKLEDADRAPSSRRARQIIIGT
jgi:hypothetical protein